MFDVNVMLVFKQQEISVSKKDDEKVWWKKIDNDEWYFRIYVSLQV